MSFTTQLLNKTSYKKSSAFTVVELLLVIAVIGILAALTIVAYSGIKNRAHVASLESDLSHNADILATDDLKNRGFPSSNEEANFGNGLQKSQGNSLAYIPSDDRGSYCLQATYETTTLHITNTNNKPLEGPCGITPIDPPEETPVEPETPAEPETPPEPVLCNSYTPGSAGPSGGVIVYAAPTQQSWGCYLEVAKAGGWWCGSNNTCDEDTFTWGCKGTNIPTPDGIGKGMAATTQIINNCPYAGTAAYAARSYTGGGEHDWYLPNKAEMKELMKFKDQLNIKYGPNWLAGTYWTSNQYNKDRGQNYQTGGTACFFLCVTVEKDIFTATGEEKDDTTFKFARPVRVF